jgi:hypothetical protein
VGKEGFKIGGKRITYISTQTVENRPPTNNFGNNINYPPVLWFYYSSVFLLKIYFLNLLRLSSKMISPEIFSDPLTFSKNKQRKKIENFLKGNFDVFAMKEKFA